MARIALAAGLLAVLVFPAGAGSAHARRTAVAIDSISPASALRGDTVSIAGNGFGGPNVRISVGGIAAKVLSATGSRASFVVPGGAPLGPTRVRMTNPGGQSAEIDFRVLFDGRVTPVLDPTHAASATIGPAGGSVSAGGMKLTVPKGALQSDQTITVTPLASLGDSPLGMLGGVQLAPQGLHFLVPATLTIPIPASVDTRNLVGFGFDAGGSSFHLTPGALAGGVLTLHISHFSGAGAGTLTPLQSAAILGYLPTPADELAEQQIAAALLVFEQTGTDPGPAIDAALNQWYFHDGVLTALQSVGTTVEFFELAAGEWMAWLGYVQEFGRQAQHAVQNAQATDLATTDAATLVDLALTACDGTGADPYAALKPVNRLSADLLTLSDSSSVAIETKKTADGRQLPAADALDLACVHVTMAAPNHPAAFAAGVTKNTITTDVSDVFWNATRTDLPITVSLFDTTDGPPALEEDETTTNGHVVLNFKPSTTGHRFYSLIAEDPQLPAGGGGAGTVGEFDAATTFDLDVRQRIEFHSDATIAPGDTVSLKALVAGDGMAGATVGFTTLGAGTFSTTTGTTDATGTASTDYTASSDPAGGTDSLTATFDDGAGPVGAGVTITITSCSPHPFRALAHVAANQCAAPVTIDSYPASITGGTFAQCIGHLGSDDHEFFDRPPPLTGSGPFSVTLSTSPAPATASCSAGTGSDSTSGGATAEGSIDSANDVLTLAGTGHGITSAVSNFTGDPFLDSCLDIGDSVGSSSDVTFTIASSMNYELTGSFVESKPRASYTLTRIAPTFAPIVDRSQGGIKPALSGTLTAGTYEFRFGDFASNDLACQVTGAATDSFIYSMQLVVHN